MKYAKHKPTTGKKATSLDKARSSLKKAEGAHTPASIKRKLKSNKEKKK